MGSVTNPTMCELSKRDSLVQAFVQLGEDPEGRITLTQVRKILDKLNIEVSEEELKHVVNEVCDEDCEKLNVDQVEVITSSPKLVRQPSIISTASTASNECNLEEEFQKLDVNDDGFITIEEVMKVMMGVKIDRLDDEEVLRRVKKADTTGEGKIEYKEFIKHYLP